MYAMHGILRFSSIFFFCHTKKTKYLNVVYLFTGVSPTRYNVIFKRTKRIDSVTRITVTKINSISSLIKITAGAPVSGERQIRISNNINNRLPIILHGKYIGPLLSTASKKFLTNNINLIIIIIDRLFDQEHTYFSFNIINW